MNPVIGLSLGRVAVGAVALANPDLAGRTFQLDTAANPQLGFMTRLFGAREVAVGLITLLTTGKTRRAAIGIGVLVDAADAGTAYLAMQDGSVSRRTATSLLAPAVGAVGAGLVALVRRG